MLYKNLILHLNMKTLQLYKISKKWLKESSKKTYQMIHFKV